MYYGSKILVALYFRSLRLTMDVGIVIANVAACFSFSLLTTFFLLTMLVAPNLVVCSEDNASKINIVILEVTIC
jgi:hypothetical protein